VGQRPNLLRYQWALHFPDGESRGLSEQIPGADLEWSKKTRTIENNSSWFLHHDNAPAHILLVLRNHFFKNSTHIDSKPPYSPDPRFESLAGTMPESFYLACLEDWKKRWHRYILSEGYKFKSPPLNLFPPDKMSNDFEQ